MQELSAAELSMLWLLRDRHTTKQAVEKAILNELPLWPEAVHLARAYHRSKKDLAGGKYYILGSDFVENERNSPYSYHELGRYPINKRRNASVPRKSSPEISEKESLRIDALDYQTPLTSSVTTQFPPISELLKDRESARDRFELDKSRHIQLLHGSGAPTTFENIDRSALDICQISGDGGSECEAGGDDVARLALAHSSGELRVATVSVEDESAMTTQEASPSAPPILGELLEQGQSAAAGLLPLEDVPKECALPNEPPVFADSNHATLPENESPPSPVRKPIFDFSEFESEIMRQCERLFRPRSPVRNFSRMLSLEDFREMSMRDESFMAFAKERGTSTGGNSEMEDVEAAVLAEFDKIDEELEQAIMSGEVMEAGEEINAGDSLPNEPSTSDKEKPKRCYVYPFDDSSSVICSDYSDDDNIGTNIFMEISEHRRVEGASSPSSCSDDSEAAPHPNVFVWLPQTWTYDINLVTNFRAPSPSARCDVVISRPDTEYAESTVLEPTRERVSSSFTYSKNPSHCGAFARKRGARLGPATSFSCQASEREVTSVDCDITSSRLNVDSCQIELVDRVSEQATISCEASKEVSGSVEREFSSHLVNDASCGVILAEHLTETANFTCQESKDEEVVSSQLFELPPLDRGCEAILSIPSTESTSLNCRAPQTHAVRLSEELNAKTSEAVEHSLQVLPTCSFESESFSCSVPKYVTKDSSWFFEVQTSSSTAVTIRDKVQCKAVLQCKASNYCDMKQKPESTQELHRLPPKKKKVHRTSMDECLLLLQLGAMPSQSIDDPCPQNSPCSSTSSSKGKFKKRRKDPRDKTSLPSSSRSQAVNFKEVGAALTAYGKSAAYRGGAENFSPHRSDLSDSPDRLVIVEDLEGVVVKDPPPDDVPLRQEPVMEPKNALKTSSVCSTQPQPFVELKPERVPSAEPPSSKQIRKTPRKRELELSPADILPPEAKRRPTATTKDNHSSPLFTSSSIEAKNQTGAIPKAKEAHQVKMKGKHESHPHETRASLPSTSAIPSVNTITKPKEALLATSRKISRSSHSPKPEPPIESPKVSPAFRAPTFSQKNAQPSSSIGPLLPPSPPIIGRSRGGSEPGGFVERVAAVVPKAKKVVLPCGTTVLVPVKIYPRPVSEFSIDDGFPVFIPRPSSADDARLRPAEPAVRQEARKSVHPPPPKLPVPHLPKLPIPHPPKLPVPHPPKLPVPHPPKLPVEGTEVTVSLSPTPRFRSCVGVSIVTEEFESEKATFKEHPAVVDAKHGDRPISKRPSEPVLEEIPETSVHRKLRNSSTETPRTSITRRSSKNAQSNDLTTSAPPKTAASAARKHPKTPAAPASTPSRALSSSVDVPTQVRTSRQKGKVSVTPAPTTPKRSKISRAPTQTMQPDENQPMLDVQENFAPDFDEEPLFRNVKECSPPVPVYLDSQVKSGKTKRANEATESPLVPKRMKTSAIERETSDSTALAYDTTLSAGPESQAALLRRKSSRLATAPPETPPSTPSTSRKLPMTGAQSSSSANDITTGDEVVVVESGYSLRRRKSVTPPIFVVAVEVTTSFVPTKRDNERSADPIILPTCNFEKVVSETLFSSDSAEILNALALDIIINEASALSTVNMATFAQFVFNLFEPTTPIFGELVDIEPSNLPANFTTIFELASPHQFRHRLDYSSFNAMLMNRLPENGLHALTLDSRRVSMLKITKFVDTVKEAVSEICEELRTRRTLSKGEIQTEKDLSSEVQHLITSRYVETMMKLADACHKAKNVPAQVIADRFHLLLCGWSCFLQQGGALRVRLQLSPMRSHPGIVDVTTAWLDQIDAILSRAQATLSTRTSAFAVSLAQEKNVMSKIWEKMAAQTSPTCADESYIHCPECKLYFHNEDTDFMHNRVFHQKSRECEECYDMFHTLLGLDLHMVGCHKRSFVSNL